MPTTLIDRLFEEHNELVSYLTGAGELSYATNVDTSFRKALLLAVASFFEVRLRELLIDYFEERSGRDELVVGFLKKKAIERQYHTYFKWDARQGNQFFGLFGSGFKTFMAAAIQADPRLGDAIRDFLELGESRNLLVHEDFAAFTLEKTVGEIYSLYQSASYFLDVLPLKLREYAPQGTI